MTPLSAIRQFVFTNVAQVPTTPGTESFAPVAIPPRQVEELPSSRGLGLQQAPAAGESTFGNVLGQFLGEVDQKQAGAGEAVNALLSGQNVSLHQAMIAMEEASVSFQLMVEVRNKLLESYQELMRMQV
jgi:flagellar hook-basal body complex protein FliE